jgi:predicted MFS family arabinose efflux permease
MTDPSPEPRPGDAQAVTQLPPPQEISFARLMATSISARLLVDIGVQMFNPFLPIFAAGLNTDVAVMGRLVSLRSAMGMLAPLFGALADRRGYRVVLRGALISGAIGMWIIGASSGIGTAMVGMVLIGLGLAGFTPTLQAYMSARLPYAQRARGMGMLEYSWALTGIIGLSLMGQLIAWTNWRVPFFILGTGMALMAVVFRSLPAAETRVRTSAPRQPWSEHVRAYFRIGKNALSTYATMAVAALTLFSAVQFMIVHGAWYADQYTLGPSELGLVALVFGVFDLIASVSVSLFTDRFGKRRSVLLGSVGALVGYLAIPWLNIGVIPAVISLGITRGFLEFAIVACFPLLSEQAPHRRAHVMTLSAALALGGATLATFIAPTVYLSFNVTGVATLSALCTAIALLLLLTVVRETPAT